MVTFELFVGLGMCIHSWTFEYVSRLISLLKKQNSSPGTCIPSCVLTFVEIIFSPLFDILILKFHIMNKAIHWGELSCVSETRL